LKCTLEFFEVPSYLKCTIAFLRGSLILEAYNVPLNFEFYTLPTIFYLNGLKEGRQTADLLPQIKLVWNQNQRNIVSNQIEEELANN
jgi:hypothetical protein